LVYQELADQGFPFSQNQLDRFGRLNQSDLPGTIPGPLLRLSWGPDPAAAAPERDSADRALSFRKKDAAWPSN